jgi:hypothetical protein
MDGEVPMFAQYFARTELKARLMSGMVDRLGVDLGKAAQQTFGIGLEQAFRACRSCTRTAECAAWQAGRTDIDRRAFCPNAARFDGMPHRVD